MMGFPFRFAINVFRGLAWLPVLHRPSQHLPIDWPDWDPALFPGLTRSSTYLAWTDSVIDLFRLDLVMDLLWSDPSLTYFCLDWLVINLLCLDWLGHQLILPGASPLSVDFRALRESLTLSLLGFRPRDTLTPHFPHWGDFHVISPLVSSLGWLGYLFFIHRVTQYFPMAWPGHCSFLVDWSVISLSSLKWLSHRLTLPELISHWLICLDWTGHWLSLPGWIGYQLLFLE